MQHRRFDLQKSPCIEEGTQVAHDSRARLEHAAALFVHDEIHVAAPVAQLRIGDAVPLVGQRTQRLGEKHQALRAHRQLARLGAKQRPLGADDIAHVPALEVLVDGTERLLLQEHLNRAARILELREACLAHHALRAHSPRDAHGDRLGLQRLGALPAVRGREIAGEGIAAKVVRKGVAALAQLGKLRATLGNQVILVGVVHQSPCFRLACMNSSRAPSSTAVVLPISTPVRRSLMRDWSNT